MNMNEEVIAALDDFEEALAASTSSPQEAIKVLRSYDLAHAPQEDLRKFIEIFSSSLQRLANRFVASEEIQGFFFHTSELTKFSPFASLR